VVALEAAVNRLNTTTGNGEGIQKLPLQQDHIGIIRTIPTTRPVDLVMTIAVGTITPVKVAEQVRGAQNPDLGLPAVEAVMVATHQEVVADLVEGIN
jgi:hypothetical protein